MKMHSRIITLDSNVLIAALKADEAYSQKCVELLEMVPDEFLLAEPSIIYQEACSTLARKAGKNIADRAKTELDRMIHPALLINCDKAFCTSAYQLCAEYNIYAIDALYLKVAIDKNATLISLDKEDFIDKLKAKEPPIKACHVSEFP